MVKKLVGRLTFLANRQLEAIVGYGMTRTIPCLVDLGKTAGEWWAGFCGLMAPGAGAWRFCKTPATWKKLRSYGIILVLIILIAGAFYLQRKRVEYDENLLRLARQQVVFGKGVENPNSLRLVPGTNEPGIGQAHSEDILPAQEKSSETIDLVARFNKDSPGTDNADRGASSAIINTAMRFLGRPYSYGAGGTASFDCSGFVAYVYSRCGISMPRVASDQARAGIRVASPAPGDLVFFSSRSDGYITHVGIYIGNNSFIHASFQGVTITSLDDPWYKERYVMACRVI